MQFVFPSNGAVNWKDGVGKTQISATYGLNPYRLKLKQNYLELEDSIK